MPKFKTPSPLPAFSRKVSTAPITYPTTLLARAAYRDPSSRRPLSLHQWRVYDAIKDLPAGQTTTYGAIVAALGGSSALAVGNALSKNPFAPVIPCHRVVASNGKLGGYKGQTSGPRIEEKVQLLRDEGVKLKEVRPGVWVVVKQDDF